MSRRKAREIALQALFQFDFTKNDDSELFSDFEKNYFVGVDKSSNILNKEK